MEYKVQPSSGGVGSLYNPPHSDPQIDPFSPRSQGSSNYGGTGSGSYVTPRDDRFYTPRAYSNSADNSEWGTPRIHSSTNTPRDPRFGSNNNTPRKGATYATPRQGSDNEIYESPRGTTPRDAKDSQGFYNYSQGYASNNLPPTASHVNSNNNNNNGYSASDYKSDHRQGAVYYNGNPNLTAYNQPNSDHKYEHNGAPAPKYEYSADSKGAYDDYYNTPSEDMQQTTDEMYETLGISEQDVQELFSYARHGRSNDIERKLNEGIPIDVRDEHGNTLLTIASQNGNKKVAKTILRRGANINTRNYKGNTPLHYCFHFGYGDSLGEYLISKGADTSLRNNAGRLCFHGI